MTYDKTFFEQTNRPSYPRTNAVIKTDVTAIDDLDLEPIRYKAKNEKKSWTDQELDHAEDAYRAFLALIYKYPDDVFVPDENIDVFWHHHILDTAKYTQDCQNIFNKYLHHFPYLGLRGEDDKKKLLSYATKTQETFKREFPTIKITEATICYMSPKV